MLLLAPGWEIPDEDIEYAYVRSSGPGGQNVNKVASKVELRVKLSRSRALTPGQKRRLFQKFPSYVTRDGDFVVTGDRFRSQAQNQRDVGERLVAMVLSVRFPPRTRVATKPSRNAKARRVSDKRARSQVKRQRQKPSMD